MITRVRLQNFRRFADVEVNFGEEHKVILITGRNGAGKSTLLEGIMFGLYGEPRSTRAGRRRASLDSLLRAGAELEGMQVEVDFTIDGTEYSVVRRRDNKVSSAELFGNGQPIVRNPREVTAEITKILGMDAAGFRLAAVAEQNELDGLASLESSKRAKTLARLLRHDSVTAAHAKARDLYNQEREIVRSMPVEDVGALEVELSAASEKLAALGAQHAESTEALARLDATLASSSDVEAHYAQAADAEARAETAVRLATEELAHAERELAGLEIPDLPQEDVLDITAVAEESTRVESAIARAEAAKELASSRQSMANELANAREQLEKTSAHIDRLSPVAARATELAGALEEVTTRQATAVTRAQQARDGKVRAQAAVETAQRRLENTETLGASCERCGQPVTEEHRLAEATRARKELDAARAVLAAAEDTVASATAHADEAQVTLDELRAELAAAEGAVHELARLEESRTELGRRISTYSAQLERQVEDPGDLDALYAERSRIRVSLALARQAAEQLRARGEALERQSLLRANVERFTRRVAEATATHDAARPSPELVAAHAAREEDKVNRQGEAEMLAYLKTQVAVATEQVHNAEAALRRAQQLAQRRTEHQERAMAAANAARILAAASAQLSTRVRPALEGSVSTLLPQLSDGRLAKVKVTDDYSFLVEDDGAFRPIAEWCSGGEQDLIALAIRLSVSEVVSDRHGPGALGLLVLDECFRFQDAARRESIRNTIRNLRNLRGQIFLISHFEDLEDVADLEIAISATTDDEGHQIAEVALI